MHAFFEKCFLKMRWVSSSLRLDYISLNLVKLRVIHLFLKIELQRPRYIGQKQPARSFLLRVCIKKGRFFRLSLFQKVLINDFIVFYLKKLWIHETNSWKDLKEKNPSKFPANLLGNSWFTFRISNTTTF